MSKHKDSAALHAIAEGAPVYLHLENSSPVLLTADDALFFIRHDETLLGVVRRLEPSDPDYDLEILAISQLEGLLDGEGATEDHEGVIAFFERVGMTPALAARLHERMMLSGVKKS